MEQIRLQKFLANSGICSRRKAEEYILAGKVEVNGKTVTELGTKIDIEKDKVTFESFVDPVYSFMNETVDRIPMSDWVFTDSPKQRGFQARSVVGGYFIKMLEEKLHTK